MNAPIEDRLRSYGAHLDRLAHSSRAHSSNRTDIRSRKQRGSRRPTWLPVVATVVVMGGAIGTALLTRSRGRDHVDEKVSATVEHACGLWTPVPAAPIAEQSRAAAVWTGNEFVVWGGRLAQMDSGSTAAISTQDRFKGAAYSPSTQTWRPIAPSPIGGDDTMVAVWTGSVVAVAVAERVIAYDPATDTWLDMSAPPVAPGGEVVAVFGDSAGNLNALAVSPLTVGTNRQLTPMAYDSTTNAWELGTSLPGGFPGLPQVSQAIGGVVVWTDTTNGWEFRASSNSWVALPTIPVPDGLQAGSIESVSDASTLTQQFVLTMKGQEGADSAMVGTVADGMWQFSPPEDGRWLPPDGFPIAALQSKILSLSNPGGTDALVIAQNGSAWTDCDDLPLARANNQVLVASPNFVFAWGGDPVGQSDGGDPARSAVGAIWTP